MAVTKPIHEIKDHLSSIIAVMAETGEEVEITRHGKVVARLVPPRPNGVVLGLGIRTNVGAPSVEDLRWNDDEIARMIDGPAIPE
jgi:prevent-host-death family protein